MTVSKISKTALSIAGLGLTLTLASAPVLAEEKVRWKVPVAFSTSLPALGDTITYVSKTLKEATGGKVHLKIFEPGKLVPPFSILDAVKGKKVQAGYTFLGYDQGKIPASALFAAVPFGLEPWEYTAWWYEGGGEKLAKDVYAKHNVVPLLCSIIGPETSGWFRNEIKSADDVKGLKIRFAGIGGKVMQKMGASVTMLPGGEIFQALEKGAIDATEFSMPAIDQKLGFNKVVKYNYFPGWHQPFTAEHLIVNKKVWDGLEDSSRALIKMACTAGVTRGLARGEALQGSVIKASAEKGVEVKTLPKELLTQLQAITADVMNAEAAKDADFKRVYESQKAFQAEYKNWKSLGYLPRDF